MLKTVENRHVGLDLAASREAPLSTLHKLRAIYEMVTDAPATTSPQELRRLSCEAFVELFEGTDYLIFGEEHLPQTAGHVFIMNHLSNQLDDLPFDHFVPTVDAHFVSAMILYRKYGEAPVRVVRKSNPGEHEHRRFYDRLGHIYVYSRRLNPAEYRLGVTLEERRRLFLDVASKHLRDGKNIVICPEGISTKTENSPLPFKAGAFRLATYARPEPLLVPVAVANFDKDITRTKLVAVVHEPVRISEHIGGTFDDRSLYEFVNDYVYKCFRDYVHEAVRLAG
jgi:1-acyl-sn-glycerol-3-phosphate acyltransferase